MSRSEDRDKLRDPGGRLHKRSGKPGVQWSHKEVCWCGEHCARRGRRAQKKAGTKSRRQREKVDAPPRSREFEMGKKSVLSAATSLFKRWERRMEKP